jgi:hypothetical protein
LWDYFPSNLMLSSEIRKGINVQIQSNKNTPDLEQKLYELSK